MTYYRQAQPSKSGGYYVRYPDGYESWSPAEAFEEGYTLVDEQSVISEDSKDTAHPEDPVQRPSVGRIVHFHDGNDWCAAIVVHVHRDKTISLAGWDFNGRRSVHANVEQGELIYNWRWPPRV